VVNGELRELALSELRGRWLVLSFDPFDFAFEWPTELAAFSDRAGEFARLGAVVVAASLESPYLSLGWWQLPRPRGRSAGFELPIVAGLAPETARAYGVLPEAEGRALRGLFVIDPAGVVRHVTIDDLPVARSVDEALRALRAVREEAGHGRARATAEPARAAS
jgi:peroxiredoxin (alkyl hydroperoxide reductase subunit C)